MSVQLQSGLTNELSPDRLQPALRNGPSDDFLLSVICNFSCELSKLLRSDSSGRLSRLTYIFPASSSRAQSEDTSQLPDVKKRGGTVGTAGWTAEQRAYGRKREMKNPSGQRTLP